MAFLWQAFPLPLIFSRLRRSPSPSAITPATQAVSKADCNYHIWSSFTRVINELEHVFQLKRNKTFA